MENNIQVESKDGVLTILEGTALTPREKKQRAIGGTIDAPSRYFQHRKDLVDLDKAFVTVNRECMCIDLFLEQNSELGDQINGSLEVLSELKELGINQDKMYSLQDLANKLKFMRYCFDDKGKNIEIVSLLKNFKGKVHKNMEQAQDGRGNMTDYIVKTVESNIPLQFTITLPIFKGGEKASFLVEIGVAERNNGISVWLESVELHDLIKEFTDKCIDDEIKKLKGLLIIEQ